MDRGDLLRPALPEGREQVVKLLLHRLDELGNYNMTPSGTRPPGTGGVTNERGPNSQRFQRMARDTCRWTSRNLETDSFRAPRRRRLRRANGSSSCHPFTSTTARPSGPGVNVEEKPEWSASAVIPLSRFTRARLNGSTKRSRRYRINTTGCQMPCRAIPFARSNCGNVLNRPSSSLQSAKSDAV